MYAVFLLLFSNILHLDMHQQSFEDFHSYLIDLVKLKINRSKLFKWIKGLQVKNQTPGSVSG
jgi:hypothetical protein